MHIGTYINIVHKSEIDLARAFDKVAKAHGAEVDILQICQLLAEWSRQKASQIEPFVGVYEGKGDNEPDRLTKTLMKHTRSGGMALLRDLHDLYLVATEVAICCTILKQGALALRDKALRDACLSIEGQTQRQLSWLQTRMKSATPQTLVAQ
jgi:hypothetical protein